MNYDTAQTIFNTIKNAQNRDLVRMFFSSAVEYANIRAKWALASGEDRREMDAGRTRSHNAFIDLCNILSREMGRAGENNSWREVLGSDRKDIGDLACFIHCMLGISAR